MHVCTFICEQRITHTTFDRNNKKKVKTCASLTDKKKSKINCRRYELPVKVCTACDPHAIKRQYAFELKWLNASSKSICTLCTHTDFLQFISYNCKTISYREEFEHI